MSVDADQSTSDTLVCLSSSAVRLDAADAEVLAQFEAALTRVCTQLAGDVARNGEGTCHVIRVRVRGAPTQALARGVGKAVVNSPLFKCAVAGNDPNVGRLVAAVGSYLGRIAPERNLRATMSMRLGGLPIFDAGSFILSPTLEDDLYEHMKAASLVPARRRGRARLPAARAVRGDRDRPGRGRRELHGGGLDLTQEYVSINADYRLVTSRAYRRQGSDSGRAPPTSEGKHTRAQVKQVCK